jgi:hypothetical protein
MAFGGMRGGGQNCCCCNDLYSNRSLTGPTRTEVARIRVNGGTSSVVTTFETTTGEYGFSTLPMDFLNKRVYGHGFKGSPITNYGIFSLTENLTDLQEAVTRSVSPLYNQTLGVWPHPATEQVFYVCGSSDGLSGEKFLRRVDYDGANDTELLSHIDTDDVTIEALNFVNVPHDGGHVYYMRRYSFFAAFPRTDDIRRCELDGANDTQIYAAPGIVTNNTSTSYNLVHLRIDNTHQKLMWCQNSPGAVLDFIRSDFDGGNVETYLTLSPAVVLARVPFWSHKKQKIYYYVTTSGADRGLWEMDYDAGNRTKIVDDADFAATYPAPFNLMPGCGFEVTGAGYQV